MLKCLFFKMNNLKYISVERCAMSTVIASEPLSKQWSYDFGERVCKGMWSTLGVWTTPHEFN